MHQPPPPLCVRVMNLRYNWTCSLLSAYHPAPSWTCSWASTIPHHSATPARRSPGISAPLSSRRILSAAYEYPRCSASSRPSDAPKPLDALLAAQCTPPSLDVLPAPQRPPDTPDLSWCSTPSLQPDAVLETRRPPDDFAPFALPHQIWPSSSHKTTYLQGKA